MKSAADHRQSLESFILQARLLFEGDLTYPEFSALLYFLVERCGADSLSPTPVFVVKENLVSCLEIDTAFKSLESQGLFVKSDKVELSPQGACMGQDGNIVGQKRLRKLWHRDFKSEEHFARVRDDIVPAALALWRMKQALAAFNAETQGLILSHLPTCPLPPFQA